MKYTKVFTLGVLVLISLSSCEYVSSRLMEKVMDTTFELDTVKWGPLQEETLTLESFHQIEAHGAVGIVYQQDTACSVKIVTCEKSKDMYKVYVEDDELCIDLRDSHSTNINHNTPGIIVNVNAPCIRKYDMSGACRLELQGKIENEEDVEIEIAGAAKIEIEDLKCKNFDLDADGAAKARVSQLKCEENAYVDIEGAGMASLEVNCRVADLEVSGAGKILVSGEVERLKQKTNGAAKIDAEHLSVKAQESNPSQTKE